MISRILNLPNNVSLFLFGARGSGKTTILKHLPFFEQSIYINLLRADEENRFARNPDSLFDIVHALPERTTHVIIDEVQKLPKLLDIVHDLIETTDKHFILTGSSARKLKHGGANLLAGRAFVYNLHPFTILEIDGKQDLKHYLNWGMLPKIFEFDDDEHKRQFLEAYTNTFLKEEVWAEQFIRELDPFRHFLEVAAQSNGKIINYTNIARDVGVDVKTVQKYFSILVDTLVGFFLNAFQHSFRKRLSKAPKFYLFDTGVVRALANQLTLPVVASTSGYGELFESFIITQIIALNSYYHREFKVSYLKTKDDAEIDLVVERPGQKILFIEIKNTEEVHATQLSTLKRLAADFGECEAVCFSRDKYAKKTASIMVWPWQDGIKHFFWRRQYFHPKPACISFVILRVAKRSRRIQRF